jgi:hypothetical protein
MCDLSQPERTAIRGHLTALDDLLAKIHESAHSIEERSWIDHETMDRLLDALTDKATEARTWVHHKVAATHS